jgi:7-cyano-7-deazaguanine synthase
MITPMTLGVRVLVSGGLDSLGCLMYYKDDSSRLDALFIDYGHPAREQELRAASEITAALQVPLNIITVQGIESTTGFVNGRNGALLQLALMTLKPSNGLIAIGIHSGTTYPDCTKLFISRMQDVFDLYTGGRVRIDAPFLEWTKPLIWTYLLEKGAPVHLSYSCERGLATPCGICVSCKDLEALRAG